jgi:hypothetical protein
MLTKAVLTLSATTLLTGVLLLSGGSNALAAASPPRQRTTPQALRAPSGTLQQRLEGDGPL